MTIYDIQVEFQKLKPDEQIQLMGLLAQKLGLRLLDNKEVTDYRAARGIFPLQSDIEQAEVTVRRLRDADWD
jgi:hypothetical protein